MPTTEIEKPGREAARRVVKKISELYVTKFELPIKHPGRDVEYSSLELKADVQA